MSYIHLANHLRKKITLNPGESFDIKDFSYFGKVISLNIRFFYLVICFLFYSEANKLFTMGWVEPTQMLWPMELLWRSLFSGNGLLLMTLALFISLFTVLFPGIFLFRLACFFIIFCYTSYRISFGSISHGYHFLVFISFLLIFLPNINYSKRVFTRRESLHFINIFWLVQFLLLFCYSLSGLWKIIGFNVQLFSADSLVIKVIQRSLQNDGGYVFWQAIAANHPITTQFLHVSMVCLQFFSILFFFRPQLIRCYGAVLIVFHFGTLFLLGITFQWHVFIWGIFFILSPIQPKNPSLIKIIYSIPFIGRVFYWVFPSAVLDTNKQGSLNEIATIVYDGECPFCSNYVSLMQLKMRLGHVELINAREHHPMVDDIKQRGLDLNQGMVFIYKGEFFYGSDAVNRMTLLSSGSGFFSVINHFMFSNKIIAKYTYPAYKLVRKITLKLLGKKLIH